MSLSLTWGRLWMQPFLLRDYSTFHETCQVLISIPVTTLFGSADLLFGWSAKRVNFRVGRLVFTNGSGSFLGSAVADLVFGGLYPFLCTVLPHLVILLPPTHLGLRRRLSRPVDRAPHLGHFQ